MGSPSSSALAARRASLAQLRGEDIVVGGAAVLLAAACVISPAGSTSGPVLCPFRALTGLPCPGCGMTRAWVAMAHGNAVDAFSYNPFGIAFFLIAVTLVTWRVSTVVAAARVPRVSLEWLSASRWGNAFLASWAIFGIVRLGWFWSTGTTY